MTNVLSTAVGDRASASVSGVQSADRRGCERPELRRLPGVGVVGLLPRVLRLVAVPPLPDLALRERQGAFRRCNWCKGKGARVRWGRRIFDAVFGRPKKEV